MTLEEAINVLGSGMLAVLLNVPNSDPIKLQLFHAIVEEWFDGSLNTIGSVEPFKSFGTSTFQQAARIIANKVDIYGDVG